MEMDALLAAWPLARPWTLRPANSGRNNLSMYVDTPAGTHLLRLYQNTGDVARRRYEHALLAQLQQAGLSFAIPPPVPTGTGETLVAVPHAGGQALASLFRLIPGHHPARDNPAHLRAAGAALGELDLALARISIVATGAALPRYGDLDRIHPLAPDPSDLPRRLPLDAARQARLARLFDGTREMIPALYAALPQQIIHSDFSMANVLLDGGRVAGVLDFEFAAPDLRAMDLAAALSMAASGAWGSGAEWARLEAFAAGYGQRLRLSPAEVAALPSLLRLHRVAGLVHWAGRRRQGLAAEEDLPRRVAELLALDGWLAVHAPELVARLAAPLADERGQPGD
jgi:homoserine kinase type II